MGIDVGTGAKCVSGHWHARALPRAVAEKLSATLISAKNVDPQGGNQHRAWRTKRPGDDGETTSEKSALNLKYRRTQVLTSPSNSVGCSQRG